MIGAIHSAGPRTELRGGVLPAGGQATVYMAEDRIAAIGTAPDGWLADEIVELDGARLLPGAVDLAARLREPGPAQPATIASELAAAAAGGTAVVCMPPDTDPVIDDPAVVEWINQRATPSRGAQVALLGALTKGLGGEALAPADALLRAGCRGLSQPGGLPTDLGALRRAMLYAAGLGATVHLCPRDLRFGTGHGIHNGSLAMRLGMDTVPGYAETIAVATIIELAVATGVRTHIGRISCGRSVALLRAAKADGIAVTADVGIANLLLDGSAAECLSPRFHLFPPLRDARDRAQLTAGVLDGTIDAICSDHQPQSDEAKNNPLAMTEPGGATVEHLWAAAWHWAQLSGCALPTLVDRLVDAPARILRLRAPALEPGAVAAVAALDFTPQQIDEARLASRGAQTALHGLTLGARVTNTWLARGLRATAVFEP